MNAFIKTLFSLMLFSIVWFAIHPMYKYLLDADAVGYLTVASRVATGDWYKSINGLWSPLNSWLLVPAIKAGYNGFTTALYLNAITNLLSLAVAISLINRFVQDKIFTTVIHICLPLVLVYYSYLQVFGDGLMLLCLLIYLYLITSKNGLNAWVNTLLIPIIIAIGFYAKTYALPFFVLHYSWIMFLQYKKTKTFAVAKYITTFIIIILLLIPWSIQLHNKYGSYSVMGNSGKLNMSWYLMRSKTFNDSINLLIPPTYSNSPSFWEDPYPLQGKLSSPFTSNVHFVKWIPRVIFTCLQAILCYGEMSCFLLPILLLFFIRFCKQALDINIAILLWAALLIPLGYLTMHIETRYIWLANIVGIILVGIYITKLTKVPYKIIASSVFGVSLLAYPIYHMEQWQYKGRNNFELAKTLTDNNITNQKITGITSEAGNMWVASLLSNNTYYTIEQNNFTAIDLSTEISRYNVQYFITENVNTALNNTITIPNYITTLVANSNNYAIYKLVKSN